jgi:predicted AlkP superfamily phosphohydrolase/phosphomutase
MIGLDGVTFDLIEPWVEAGHLPNLARMMNQGASGRLQSTIPAHSGPAWATFATGQSPGKHGVYFFLGPSRDQQYFRPLSAESIRGRRFWELASEIGRTVGIVNVPLTYPLRPIEQGYLIAGIFAPNAASAFSSPKMYDEIINHCGGYTVEAPKHQNRQTYLANMMAGMQLRCKTAEYLLEHYPVDLFVVVFRMIDSIMHNFWADMDTQHPLRQRLGKALIPDAILNAYKLLDDSVGRLVARAGEDTIVMVMSDHGFRAEYKRFAVNKWLRERGLLTLRSGRGPLMSAAGLTIKRLGLTKLAKRTISLMTGNSTWQQNVWGAVDWSRTQVVYGPGPGLYVNLKGRDVEGIVKPSDYENLRSMLIEELKTIRDPETGLAVVDQVHRREEIYQGDAVDLAPDLVPEPAEYGSNGLRWGYGFEPFPAAPWDFHTVERYAGVHAPDGIFLATGPHITPGPKKNVLHIADLAPTSLYALGLPVPQAMDGQVLTDLFHPSYVEANPVQFVDLDLHTDGKMGQVMSEEDEGEVKARLKDLGYL